MIQPPPSRYPGPGRQPSASDVARYQRTTDALQQANPADGGTTGIGVDSGGTQLRDWGSAPILAKITSHGAANAYGFEEVYLSDDVGTITTLDGGLTGDDVDSPAFEVNGSTTVPVDTIVELWPNYGPEPFWTFVEPSSGGGAILADLIHVTAQTANLGSHLQFTCKSIVRNAGTGTWEEGGLGLTYTGVFENQDRPCVIDGSSTVTGEAVHPLYVDENGKYTFSIDQYTAGAAATPLAGLVSLTTQTFKGEKNFLDDVVINTGRALATSPVVPPLRVQTNSGAVYAYSLTVYATESASPGSGGASVGSGSLADWNNTHPLSVDGTVQCAGLVNFVTIGSSSGTLIYGYVSGAAGAVDGSDPNAIHQGGTEIGYYPAGSSDSRVAKAGIYYIYGTVATATGNSTGRPLFLIESDNIVYGLPVAYGIVRSSLTYPGIDEYPVSLTGAGGGTTDLYFLGGILVNSTRAIGAAGGAGGGGGVPADGGIPAVGAGGPAIDEGGPVIP